jgi:HpcH/HpaI aldolase/citrate lyase family
VFVMVEGTKGIAALPEIVTTSGLDGIFIGPFDLSQTMAVPGQVEHPSVIAAIESIVASAATHGMVTAIYALRPWRARSRALNQPVHDDDVKQKGREDFETDVLAPRGRKRRRSKFPSFGCFAESRFCQIVDDRTKNPKRRHKNQLCGESSRYRITSQQKPDSRKRQHDHTENNMPGDRFADP